ncbi:MAG: diacylglycerol kinase family lipid kinase [Opitutaceae bacterium]|nr:diacylglycerol kinase family lipid kinase [Opitutaceae bacterium]
MESDHPTLRASPDLRPDGPARGRDRFKLIFNPKSGRNARDTRILERARRFVQECPGAELAFTEAPHHATELAREAAEAGFDCVVAIGGDGTLNEVAAALAGTEVSLGLVPCGSGNGLGRHLGIPGPGRGAFKTLLEGRIRTIDTGVVNGIPFFNAMGLGFDAEISQRFNRLTRRGLGAYVRTTLRLLHAYQPEHYTIEWPGGGLRLEAFILAIANSDQYGNDCFIAPGARVDDGLVNLTALPRVSLGNAIPLAIRLFNRSIHQAGTVKTGQAPSFVIHRSRPGLVHTDGEIREMPQTLHVACRPRSLNIRVPGTSRS